MWLKYRPSCLFFPDLVTGSGSANPVSTARGLSTAQREACMRSLTTQKPKRLPRVKGAYRKFRAALADFRVGAPMDCVAVDIMGPLPELLRGNRYILVVVEYFTRWVEAFPLADQKARTVAHKVVELHTDQGRIFESDLFQEVCKLQEVTKTRSTPYHPGANGLVERFNHTLGSMIRSYLDSDCGDWDLYIPMLTDTYRATSHPAIGFTPNFLILGRDNDSTT